MASLQLPKKHVPWVGLMSVALVAVAGGTVYFYQFVIPHVTSCGPPAHRLIFLDAIIQELGGFTIKNAAYLNQTGLPGYSNQTGPVLDGVVFSNYKVSSNETIEANVGDTITIYYHSIDSKDPLQVSTAHGFALGDPYNINKIMIPWGTGPQGDWWSVTFQVTNAGDFTYRCANFCSPQHTSMIGFLTVHGCG